MEVPVSALDELFDTFLTVQARITANLEAHASSLGLNASQLLVIRDVLDHPGTSLKDSCQRCGLKKSAASRLIDALVERKMIIRQECPTSRRAVSLHLGPALDGSFCRVTALTSALPGWDNVKSPTAYSELKTGLEAFFEVDPGVIRAVHHVALIVSDYARSKVFYTDVLGLKVLAETYRAERQSYKLDLQIPGGAQIELFSFPNPPPRPTRPEATGLRHLAFATADLDAALKRLWSLGVETEPVRLDEFTGRRFTFFFDPDGLPLELYED